MLRRLEPIVWVEAIVMLIAVTAWVRWWFVPYWLVPHYRPPRGIFRVTTSTMGAVFDLLRAQPRGPERTFVLIGDAAVHGAFGKGALAEPLREVLGRQIGTPVAVVDLSVPDAYLRDVAVLAARAMALAPDRVLIALDPRMTPTDPRRRWATTADAVALDPRVVRHLGLDTVLALLGLRDVPRSLVHSYWPVARLRTELTAALVGLTPQPLPLLLGVFVVQAPPGPAAELPGEDGVLWHGAHYALAGNSDATAVLDGILALCRREQRCLLFHPPVNRAARGRFEPGLMEALIATVSDRSGAAGVPFADLHSAVAPDGFVVEGDEPAPLHLTDAGAARLAEALATIGGVGARGWSQ